MEPVLVISTHGIRTKGAWQEVLAQSLKSNRIAFRADKFGVYPIYKFLRQSSNDAMVERFYNEYQTFVAQAGSSIDLSDYRKRPSVIAHSFGSYLVGYVMLKYEHVVFDKILLCGAILPSDFDWWTLISRDQVNLIRNEYGSKDIWARRVGKWVPRTGDGGANGFQIRSNSFSEQHFSEYEHSTFFSSLHIDTHWIPFLRRDVSRFAVQHGRDLSPDQLIAFMQQTEQVDSERFDTIPGYQNVKVTLEQGREWIEINPDIYTFLIDRQTGNAVGYVNAMPVIKDIFDKLARGEITDNEIIADHLLPFTPGVDVHMYCMSIAISKDVISVSKGLFNDAVERLLGGFCSKLIRLAVTDSVHVTDMLAVGWTSQGRKLCECLGMAKTDLNDRFRNPIFRVDLNSVQARSGFVCVENLIDVYRKRQKHY